MAKSRNGDNPRSVALVGPQGSGKSALFDALMDAADAAVKRPADPRNRPATTASPETASRAAHAPMNTESASW